MCRCLLSARRMSRPVCLLHSLLVWSWYPILSYLLHLLLAFRFWYLLNSCAICSSCLDPFCLPYFRSLPVVWFVADCTSRLASPAGRCSRGRLAPTTFSTRADSPFASILHLVSLSRLAVAAASPRRPASIAPPRWRPALSSCTCFLYSLFCSSCRLLAAIASPDGTCISPCPCSFIRSSVRFFCSLPDCTSRLAARLLVSDLPPLCCYADGLHVSLNQLINGYPQRLCASLPDFLPIHSMASLLLLCLRYLLDA